MRLDTRSGLLPPRFLRANLAEPGAKVTVGNRYLKGALGAAAMSSARTKDTYLAAKYRRIASRRGPV